MDDTLISVIGFIAAFGTTAAWFPQVHKTLTTKSARDFSWGYLSLLTTGVLLWVAYGVMRRDAAVTAANVVTTFLVVCVVWVKAREVRAVAGGRG